MVRISNKEKQRAVEHCVSHERDYALAAAYMGFTYQQVYGWVRKYHKAGLDGLSGRRCSPKEHPDWVVEKGRLETDNLHLEIELALYRKLQQYRRQCFK